MKHPQLFLLSLTLILLSLPTSARDTLNASGFVYDDRNRNGKRDPGEPGLPNVLVSNQREVVPTDVMGRWTLPVRDDCIFFVIKPRGWMPPVSDQQLPRFYYLHKPKGSPQSKFPGVKPTGPLPASIDFPLTRQDEPFKFKAHFFGDTQSRNTKELDFMARDTIQELIGTDAEFGVTLGDILFDDLSLFETHNSIVALVGVPWWNVIGNHDLNFDAPDDRTSDETFERVYGPPYHAFTWGPVNFVVLDNVMWGGSKKSGGTGGYTGELGEEQLAFLENLLPHLPENELLMLMMHIPLKTSESPLTPSPERDRLFRLIEKRPYTMSISGHTHWHAHMFLDEKDGWKGKKPHHHVVN
ncbi:MAG TPA: metallophosphoesterase, partial [Verrucomicrobiales bacterium]|nr:metallophosphoesterase [Verrucomicrobiales bacterium]